MSSRGQHAELQAIQGGGGPSPLDQTDLSVGRRLVDRNHPTLRYCEPWRTWFVFDGHRWRESSLAPQELVKEVAKGMVAMLPPADSDGFRGAAKFVQYVASARGASNVLAMASSDPRVVITPDQFDVDPLALHALNGVVDLRHGTRSKADPSRLNRKLAGADYISGHHSELFERALERALPNPEVRAFLQVLMGAAAIGRHVERVLIAHGTGANSKGTIFDAISAALGDYASAVDSAILVGKARTRGGEASPELAQLLGLRLAVASEIPPRSKLNDKLVKDLSSGDAVSARRLYRESFTFLPTHLVVLQTNHRPELEVVDEALRRRVIFLPFEVTIPPEERDESVKRRLRTDGLELAGVLSWLVEGAMRYLDEGLVVPEVVSEATADYLDEFDDVGHFVEEACLVRPDVTVTVAALHEAYERWARNDGREPKNKRELADEMTRRGYARGRNKRSRFWRGLATR